MTLSLLAHSSRSSTATVTLSLFAHSSRSSTATVRLPLLAHRRLERSQSVKWFTHCIVLDLLIEGMLLLLVLVRQVHTRTGTRLVVRLTAQPNIARMVECKEGSSSHNQQVDTNVKLAAFKQQRIRNVPVKTQRWE